MKVKVVKSFIDRHSLKSVEEGAVIEISLERFEEIKKAGHYVDIVAEPSMPIKEGRNNGKRKNNQNTNSR